MSPSEAICVITSYSIHYTKLYEIAMNMVKTLAGMELDRDITLAGTLEEIPPEPADVALQRAFETRTDIRMLEMETELRGTAVRAARSSYFPVVTGTVAFNYRNNFV